jgi:hypothetical protein
MEETIDSFPLISAEEIGRWFLKRPGKDGKAVDAQQSLDDGVQLAHDGFVDLGTLRYKVEKVDANRQRYTVTARVKSSHFSAVSYITFVEGVVHAESVSKATPKGILSYEKAGCNCCVGLGETDKHVSALSWALCDVTQRRRLDTCTSVRNAWIGKQASEFSRRSAHQKMYSLETAKNAIDVNSGSAYVYDPSKCEQVSLEKLRLHLEGIGIHAAMFAHSDMCKDSSAHSISSSPLKNRPAKKFRTSEGTPAPTNPNPLSPARSPVRRKTKIRDDSSSFNLLSFNLSTQSTDAGRRLFVDVDSYAPSSGSSSSADIDDHDQYWLKYTPQNVYIELKISDRNILENGEMLTDRHMNAARKIIRHQFPGFPGDVSMSDASMQDTLIVSQGTPNMSYLYAQRSLQFHHTGELHWNVSYMRAGADHVEIYDSLYRVCPANLAMQLLNLYGDLARNKVKFEIFQHQRGALDCGLFAIAAAVEICFGGDPSLLDEGAFFDQERMRPHLKECFTAGRFTVFPRTQSLRPRIAGVEIKNLTRTGKGN